MTDPMYRVLAHALAEVRDPGFADEALAAPEADLFSLGMNSLQAFDVLDRLIDELGVDVDYAEFTSTPTVAFLLSQGSAQQPGQSRAEQAS